MGLFQKEKKISDREKLLGQELSNARYNSLPSALIGELSIGSLDSKITKISFPNEREIVVLSNAGKIILARDSARPVNLSAFLYWTDLSAADKSTVLLLANDSPLNENLLGPIALKAPDTLNVIRKAILDSTFEALLYAHREFDSYTAIHTDLYRNPDVIKQLDPQGIDAQELESLLRRTVLREEELQKILGIAGIPAHELKLERGLGSDAGEVYVLEKRFVIAAAEAEANLADTYEISSGFRWVSVLQRLYELIEDKTVRIEITSAVEALPSEIVIQRPHEKIFHLTLDVESSLEALVDSVFEFSGDLELARKLASDNGILEERIFEIEDWIIRELATEDYDDFDDLPEDFQISLRGLLLERREINGKRVEMLQRLSSLIIEDAHSTEDDQLRERIASKLKAIALAVDNLPSSHEEVAESDFHLAEEKPEFNFNDGRIVQDDSGSLQVQHLEHGEGIEEEEEPAHVDLEEMIKLAVEKEREDAEELPVKPLYSPVDTALLEDHLARLSTPRRKK